MERKAKWISGLPEPKTDFESASKRLMPRGYVKVSEKINDKCGLIASAVLGVLINKRDQDDRYHQLPPDGSFVISIGEIERRTGTSRKTIYKAVDTLVNHGLIEYDKGEVGKMGSHRSYRLKEEAISRANAGEEDAGGDSLLDELLPYGKIPHVAF